MHSHCVLKSADDHTTFDVQAGHSVSQCQQDALNAYFARRAGLMETSACQVSKALPSSAGSAVCVDHTMLAVHEESNAGEDG